GAAAGMSATFGAPLASVMLAIELLLFEFSPRAFIPLVVASSIAAGIHSTIFGSGPLFHVPHHDYAGLGQLPAYAALGLARGALASTASGGTLAAIVLISASFGGLLGRGLHNLAPGLGVSAGAFAVVAMAATFGAATRAPFTSIVFVFELTGDYNVVLPLMLATVMASLVAAAFLEDSIMTEKLTRRGVRVGGELHVDVLRTTLVGDVMTCDVMTIPAGATIDEAEAMMAAGGHGAYPVVDEDGRCVALLERRDLLV